MHSPTATLSSTASTTRSMFRTLSIAGCLAGISVLALGSSALAQTTTTAPGSTGTKAANRMNGRPAPLTEAQQACLTAKGFGPKSKPPRTTSGSTATTTATTIPKAPKTEAQRTADRAARDAAAAACGVTLPTGGPGGRGHGGPDGRGHGDRGGPRGVALTAEQQACLTAKGFPATSAGRGNSTVKSAEQRAAFEAAAKSCGITVPTGGPGHGHDRSGRGGVSGSGSRSTTASTTPSTTTKV